MSEKTYIFGEEGGSTNGVLSLLGPLMQQRGIDPNVLLAMRDNNGFGEGGWFMWIFFLIILGGWGGYGGFGNRGNGFLTSEINNDFGREWLLQAINGNGNAIQQLATTLHCDVNQISNAINTVQSSIANVSSQIGLSSSQIINSIQSGNSQIAAQLASCCCDVKTGLERGFASVNENTFRQTCDIEKSIAASTSAITARLDAMEKTSLLDKIDKLREDKATLTNQLSQEHQSLAIFQNTAAELAPITASINSLHHELDSLKCKMPTTVTANYSPYTVVPTCAYNAFNNCGWGWNGYNGNLWG
jgi:prefoldin subunit 5